MILTTTKARPSWFIRLGHSLCYATQCSMSVPIVATAAESPEWTVHINVPFATGGGADVLARLAGAGTQADVPQGVMVENRAGSGGNIGADCLQSRHRTQWPAGVFALPHVVNQGLYPSLPFDPTKRAPVAILASNVKTAMGFHRSSQSSSGRSEPCHAGQRHCNASHGVDVFFGGVSAAFQLHKAGRAKFLAVAESHQAEVLPDVPTFAEPGLDSMVSLTLFVMIAPPDTPIAMLTRINTWSPGQSPARCRVRSCEPGAGAGRAQHRADRVIRQIRDRTPVEADPRRRRDARLSCLAGQVHARSRTPRYQAKTHAVIKHGAASAGELDRPVVDGAGLLAVPQREVGLAGLLLQRSAHGN